MTQTSGLPWEALAAVTVIFSSSLFCREKHLVFAFITFLLDSWSISGIVTEFLYKVYPRPEVKPHYKDSPDCCAPFLYNCHVKVRPVVIPLTLASVQDFQRLEEAAHATKRYLFRFQHNNQAALKAGLLRIYQSYNLYSIDSLII